MKYSHWELLLGIFQRQETPFRMMTIQANKNLLKTCLKQGWVKELDDNTLIVTSKGIDSALEISPLYERDTSPQFGQTY